MIRRLLLVRHGVTTWNREGRFQGHLDPPLDAPGEREAHLLARRLVTEGGEPLRIIASPLRRAADTATIVATALASVGRLVSSVTDPRLVEIGQGEWEGRTHADLEVNDAARYADWRGDSGRTPPPGGETAADALQRFAGVVGDLLDDRGWPVCLVSHGGILRLAASHLLQLDLGRAWSLDVDNASLSRLSLETDAAGWRIDAWNDTGHLLGHEAMHVDEAGGAPLAL